MYICLCNGFTDGQVRRSADAGPCSVGQIYQALGCRPKCGKCVPLVRDILRDSGARAADGEKSA
jgi:bacterioferritin-associated ferredoxin